MEYFSIASTIQERARLAEECCTKAFAKIDHVNRYNAEKVLYAFGKHHVSEACFAGSTGYGYGDHGRDTLDRVWAEVFCAEDALVRHNFVSGTHALTVALFGCLRGGDLLLPITGKPYDTLEQVIGMGEYASGKSTLAAHGVRYAQVDLTPEGKPDLLTIAESLKKQQPKIAYIQRSRGYSLRPALTISEIEELVTLCRTYSPSSIIMVDNCYGEFVEDREPIEIGADLCIGSLIKNAGGGIARTGGYITGKAELVELCAERLTCPGMGKEVGCTLSTTRDMLQGLYLAPDVTANALKTATFAAQLFEDLGFTASPHPNEPRGDIVTALQLRTPENLIAFCQGIQKGSPVDAFVTPEPWDMPGYTNQVIMAAGAFTAGASIELSADAPLREPYAVWMQGGLSYHASRMGILLATQEMVHRGLLTL